MHAVIASALVVKDAGSITAPRQRKKPAFRGRRELSRGGVRSGTSCNWYLWAEAGLVVRGTPQDSASPVSGARDPRGSRAETWLPGCEGRRRSSVFAAPDWEGGDSTSGSNSSAEDGHMTRARGEGIVSCSHNMVGVMMIFIIVLALRGASPQLRACTGRKGRGEEASSVCTTNSL